MKSLFKNKNARISILIITFLAFIGLGFLVFNTGIKNNYNAELSLVNGRVEQSTKSGVWSGLKSGVSIAQGSLVRTGADSRAIVTLDDGSAIRMDANSQMQLTSLDPNSIVITNQKGEVYTRVVKADRSFVVNSGGESFKSLGTAYKTVNTKDEQGVYVYESKVKAEVAKTEVPMGSKFLTKTGDKSLVKKLVNISTDEITKDVFIQWNKELDKKDKEFQKNLGILKDTVAPTAPASDEKPATEPVKNDNGSGGSAVPSIYLTGSKVDGGIMFNWSTSNLEAKSGFKLVKGTAANPTYPGNSAAYLSDVNARSYKFGITNGATYNFRICRYTGSGCDVYSNNIVVQAPYVAEPASVVNSISLTSLGGGSIKWTVDGYSKNGFKVVWSKTSGPTYPNRVTDRYHYHSSPSQTIDTIDAWDGSGSYNVRVCEYLSGSCGVYSNEIIVAL